LKDSFTRINAARLIVCALCIAIFSFAFATQAQTRRTTQRRRSTTTATRSTPPSALNEARTRLADQLKTLTRFIYLYGRISRDVEATDEQVRRGALPNEATATVNQSRAALRGNLQNVREGLDSLEQYFRTTPGLERYYTELAGVAVAASDAEDYAATGQLDRAGRKLVDIAQKLADVLADMK
jgi:hypothetical protein